MDDDGQDKGVAEVEAMQAKAAEARAQALNEADAAERDLLEQLAKVEDSAGRSRRSLERAHAKEESKRQESQETGRGLGVGLTIAYAIIGTPIAGYVVGFLIDGRPNGPFGSGLALLGAFGGVAYAVLAVQRQNKA